MTNYSIRNAAVLVVACLFLCSCGERSKNDSRSNPGVIEQHSKATSTRPKSPIQPTSEQEECTRGEAEPILSPMQNAPTPSFAKTGKYEAIEKAKLDDNTTLTVRQFGCTHFAVEYTFEIQGAGSKTAKYADWLLRASDLISKLHVVSEHQTTLQMISNVLKQKSTGQHSSGQPFPISESETVTVAVTMTANGAKLTILYDMSL